MGRGERQPGNAAGTGDVAGTGDTAGRWSQDGFSQRPTQATRRGWPHHGRRLQSPWLELTKCLENEGRNPRKEQAQREDIPIQYINAPHVLV